ncbi:MAG: glycosyltransferase family 4 protein [Anaerolineae bacterium]|nr:glycosyltransferase family 4 protein [Anaerolineae bacterium]MDW8172010.1 glycosyltransferase family 1 protein [Anaerolineae bacterium]
MARIGIAAQFRDGKQGGVQQFVIGLAQGLSRLSGDDEYIFFAYADQTEWLKPYLSGPCRLEITHPAPDVPWYKRPFRQSKALRRVWHALRQRTSHVVVPRSDGFIESYKLDLMHFTNQDAFLTTVPSIYHPWDLQHLHLPNFFTPLEREHRETRYRAFCEQARMVAAASTWIRDDLLAHYALPSDKVRVVPMASVLVGYPQPSETQIQALRARLPQRFLYYPAQTWPHKNHLGLLEALALLRDNYQLRVPVVFSGGQNAYAKIIRRTIKRLRLNGQVISLGYVSQTEVQALYQLAEALVFPSLFEGWGLPITEAMSAGLPILCARTTHLPRLVANAGLLFDPYDPHAIAQAIRQLWTDSALRRDLRARSLARASLFTWETTARHFSAHYHRLLGQTLNPQEQALLDAPPLV